MSQLELKWAEDCRMCPTYLYEAVTYALDAAAALFLSAKAKKLRDKTPYDALEVKLKPI